MARLIEPLQVVKLNWGDVVWLETYVDGATTLEPFMYDYEVGQHPILVGGRDYFFATSSFEMCRKIIGDIEEDAHYKYEKILIRFWCARPSDEERTKERKWHGLKLNN